MRMTALVNNVSPARRAQLETVALAASLAFLILLLAPAIEYAHEEHFIITPALELSNAWRASAIPVGMGLMAVVAVLRLLRTQPLPQVLMALVGVAVVVAVFWRAQPLFKGLGKINLVIFFVGIVAATVFSGVPIAFSSWSGGWTMASRT
ncbi:hypothetical protein G6F32_015816 [Rhizopus arrhizus]|nr:hypothetical protein G6F32_015816 [Rhizopus arrhizus]